MPRQPSEDALIWQMARKSYEARQRYMSVGGQWGSLSQEQRDIEFDALWHALHELLMPSEAMTTAGELLQGVNSADWTGSDTIFRAMINKLLEV